MHLFSPQNSNSCEHAKAADTMQTMVASKVFTSAKWCFSWFVMVKSAPNSTRGPQRLAGNKIKISCAYRSHCNAWQDCKGCKNLGIEASLADAASKTMPNNPYRLPDTQICSQEHLRRCQPIRKCMRGQCEGMTLPQAATLKVDVPWAVPLMLLHIVTGQQCGCVTRARVGWINFDSCRLTIPKVTGKTGKTPKHEIALSPWLRDLIQHWLLTQPLLGADGGDAFQHNGHGPAKALMMMFVSSLGKNSGGDGLGGPVDTPVTNSQFFCETQTPNSHNSLHSQIHSNHATSGHEVMDSHIAAASLATRSWGKRWSMKSSKVFGGQNWGSNFWQQQQAQRNSPCLAIVTKVYIMTLSPCQATQIV